MKEQIKKSLEESQKNKFGFPFGTAPIKSQEKIDALAQQVLEIAVVQELTMSEFSQLLGILDFWVKERPDTKTQNSKVEDFLNISVTEVDKLTAGAGMLC